MTSPIAPPAAAKPTRDTGVERLVRLDDRVLLPDFLGMTVDEVRQIIADASLSVRFTGRGRAVQQDPPPGTVVAVSAGSVHIVFESLDAALPVEEG